MGLGSRLGSAAGLGDWARRLGSAAGSARPLLNAAYQLGWCPAIDRADRQVPSPFRPGSASTAHQSKFRDTSPAGAMRRQPSPGPPPPVSRKFRVAPRGAHRPDQYAAIFGRAIVTSHQPDRCAAIWAAAARLGGGGGAAGRRRRGSAAAAGRLGDGGGWATAAAAGRLGDGGGWAGRRRGWAAARRRGWAAAAADRCAAIATR